MASEGNKSYEALERSFAEFSRRVKESLDAIGRELDSIHKRMADGEAAAVRASSDLGTFKELVRDDLEALDDRVDDALFTPSHYGPSSDGATAAYTVRSVDAGGGPEFEIYLPAGCLVVAGSEVDVAAAASLEEGSGADWYKLGLDEGPVYLHVTSRHSGDMTLQAGDGDLNDGDDLDAHYDRVTSVMDGQVEVEFSDASRESASGPEDCEGWLDCVKICDLGGDDGPSVAQVALGTIVLDGPPTEPVLAFPADRWERYDNGVQRSAPSDPAEETAADLLQFSRGQDGCARFSAPLQVVASGRVSARLYAPASPGTPAVLDINGFGDDDDEVEVVTGVSFSFDSSDQLVATVTKQTVVVLSAGSETSDDVPLPLYKATVVTGSEYNTQNTGQHEFVNFTEDGVVSSRGSQPATQSVFTSTALSAE